MSQEIGACPIPTPVDTGKNWLRLPHQVQSTILQLLCYEDQLAFVSTCSGIRQTAAHASSPVVKSIYITQRTMFLPSTQESPSSSIVAGSTQPLALALLGFSHLRSVAFLSSFTQRYHAQLSSLKTLKLILNPNLPAELAEELQKLLSSCPSLSNLILEPNHGIHLHLKEPHPGAGLSHLHTLFAPQPHLHSDPLPQNLHTPATPATHTSGTPDAQDAHQTLFHSLAVRHHLHSLAWDRSHATDTNHSPFSTPNFSTLATFSALRDLTFNCRHELAHLSHLGVLSQLTKLHATIASDPLPRCGAYRESPHLLVLVRTAVWDQVPLLTNLRELELYHNAESFPKGRGDDVNAVPPSWSSLRALTRLCLRGVEVGPQSGVYRLPSLQHLELQDCRAVPRGMPGAPAGVAAPTFDGLTQLLGLQHLAITALEPSQEEDDVEDLDDEPAAGDGEEGILHLPDGISALSALTQLAVCRQVRIRALPDSITRLHHLQVLNLSHSKRLVALPQNIGPLQQLQVLNLQSCKSLTSLPPTTSTLTSLHTLNLSVCSSLRSLPQHLGQLPWVQSMLFYPGSLTHLPEDSTSWLQNQPDPSLSFHLFTSLLSLPCDIGTLTHLQHLDLHNCHALQDLPDSLCDLTGLLSLNCSCCFSLQLLPEELGNLTLLTSLNLSSCTQLAVLPESIGTCSQLLELTLTGCSELRCLPESLGALTLLTELDLTGCHLLDSLPESIGMLAQLKHLNLSTCSFESMPLQVAMLTGLSSLELSNRRQFAQLPSGVLGPLTMLESLTVTYSRCLEEIPECIGTLTMLRTLDLTCCTALKAPPSTISQLAGCLESLVLKGSGLGKLPEGIGSLTKLTTLDLRGCNRLTELPEDIGGLVNLRVLDISDCWRLRTIPVGVRKLHRLENVRWAGIGVEEWQVPKQWKVDE